MTRRLFPVIALLICCGDKPDDTGAAPASSEPDILVSPSSIDFGFLEVGQQAAYTEIVRIQNLGEGSLNLGALELQPVDAPFEAGLLGAPLVEAGGSVDLELSFDPQQHGEFEATLSIASDDPDTPSASVALQGLGLAPMVDLAPQYYDFGTVTIGCEHQLELHVTNIGSDTLEVLGLRMDSASGELVLRSVVQDPWTVVPGSSADITVSYAPVDEHYDVAYLSVQTNDPSGEDALSTIQGNGTVATELITDSWTQPEPATTDMIIAVNTSTSMEEQLLWIPEALGHMQEFLAGRGRDFQIAIVTDGTGCVAGDEAWIHQDHSRDEAEALAQAMLVPPNDGWEHATFHLLEAALQESGSGGCNEGRRDDAKLSLLGISDAADGSGGEWSTWVASLQQHVDDPADLVFHAIGGDYPSGCDDADPYTGMFEAVAATGGLFMSLCDTDQEANMEAMARHTAGAMNRFDLSEAPVQDTIEVRINGATATDWAYSETWQAVFFDEDHTPESGASIEIEYTVLPAC
jgi:hypothetical protein